MQPAAYIRWRRRKLNPEQALYEREAIVEAANERADGGGGGGFANK